MASIWPIRPIFWKVFGAVSPLMEYWTDTSVFTVCKSLEEDNADDLVLFKRIFTWITVSINGILKCTPSFKGIGFTAPKVLTTPTFPDSTITNELVATTTRIRSKRIYFMDPSAFKLGNWNSGKLCCGVILNSFEMVWNSKTLTKPYYGFTIIDRKELNKSQNSHAQTRRI